MNLIEILYPMQNNKIVKDVAKNKKQRAVLVITVLVESITKRAVG